MKTNCCYVLGTTGGYVDAGCVNYSLLMTLQAATVFAV